MTIHVADLDLIDGRASRTPARCAAMIDGTLRVDEQRLRAPRGIIFAMLLATPFWVAVGVGFYYHW